MAVLIEPTIRLNSLNIGEKIYEPTLGSYFIILDKKYSINSDKVQDGVLIGQVLPTNKSFFDGSSAIYDTSAIRQSLNTTIYNSFPSGLRNAIVPTMISSNLEEIGGVLTNSVHLIGPDNCFLPSASERDISLTTLDGIPLDKSNINIKDYLENTESYRTLGVLTRSGNVDNTVIIDSAAGVIKASVDVNYSIEVWMVLDGSTILSYDGTRYNLTYETVFYNTSNIVIDLRDNLVKLQTIINNINDNIDSYKPSKYGSINTAQNFITNVNNYLGSNTFYNRNIVLQYNTSVLDLISTMSFGLTDAITGNETRADLRLLIDEANELLNDYEFISKTVINVRIEEANNTLGNVSASNNDLQVCFNNLNNAIFQFRDQIKFELYIDEVINLEIGSLGSQFTGEVIVISNFKEEPLIFVQNPSIVSVSSPKISNVISPIGIARAYPIVGTNVGSTNITFSLNGKELIVPINVFEKDSVNLEYLAMKSDIDKVSIYQIESGRKDMEHLGIRLSDIEQRVLLSESGMDPNLINLLNITTPVPVINNVEIILIKDADITTGQDTIINVSKSYYTGKNHLLVFRNGIYLRSNINYVELNKRQISFRPNYLKPGDKLTLIIGNIGDDKITRSSIIYNDDSTIQTITFYSDSEIIKQMSFTYNSDKQLTKQTISDSLYIFDKIFTYDDGRISEVDFAVTVK